MIRQMRSLIKGVLSRGEDLRQLAGYYRRRQQDLIELIYQLQGFIVDVLKLIKEVRQPAITRCPAGAALRNTDANLVTLEPVLEYAGEDAGFNIQLDDLSRAQIARKTKLEEKDKGKDKDKGKL